MLQFIFLFCFIICSFDVVIDFFVCCSSFFHLLHHMFFHCFNSLFFCCCSWCWARSRGELAMGGSEVLGAGEVGGGQISCMWEAG
jgi:hypothetical protein